MGEIPYNKEKIAGYWAAPCQSRINMASFEPLNDLEKIPLFRGLNPKHLEWLRGRLYARVFPANKDMMVSGMPGDLLYIIISGTVKVYIPQEDGGEVIVAILGPGDPVGEISMIEPTDHTASVVTLEETLALWINRVNFQQALETIPLLSQNLARILSGRLRSSTGQIQALAVLDVSGRVARQLLTFARRYGQVGEAGEVFIPIRLTQTDLAGLVGATRRRVNQAMAIFKHNQWISVDAGYHITLLNQKALEGLLK